MTIPALVLSALISGAFIVGHWIGSRQRTFTTILTPDRADLASVVSEVIRTNHLGCLTTIIRALEQSVRQLRPGNGKGRGDKDCAS